VEQKIAAVIVQPSLPLKDVADLALRYRLPSGCPLQEFPQLGGFIGYSVDTVTNQRQAARIVDKILKGAKPADLPVEQPTKFELVINMKTANAIGLMIPPAFLARADEVIE
jgi:putative ABC transport system substrate-binding protein